MKIRTLDVSGLEPPGPIQEIIKELNYIDDETILIVIHKREPCLLYPVLEKNGFDYSLEEKEGQFHIQIRKKK